MNRTKLHSTSICLAILTIFMIATAAQAQTTTNLDYRWGAPSTGSPVDHYVVQHSVNGGTWTEVSTVSSLTYTLTATYGDAHQIRVAGVDAEGRQGIWSEPSDAYTPDPGSPGQPGKPILF